MVSQNCTTPITTAQQWTAAYKALLTHNTKTLPSLAPFEPSLFTVRFGAKPEECLQLLTYRMLEAPWCQFTTFLNLFKISILFVLFRVAFNHFLFIDLIFYKFSHKERLNEIDCGCSCSFFCKQSNEPKKDPEAKKSGHKLNNFFSFKLDFFFSCQGHS